VGFRLWRAEKQFILHGFDSHRHAATDERWRVTRECHRQIAARRSPDVAHSTRVGAFYENVQTSAN